MAWILCIETATRVCSVALCLDDEVKFWRESKNPNTHSAHLAPYIEEIFQEAGKELSALDAVAISKGPGSYTGLRIGVSTAKGLGYALDIPLIAVSTLQAMAGGAVSKYPGYIRYCPMIDAKRMEVYTAMFDSKLDLHGEIQASIITSDSFRDELTGGEILFFGDGVEKCRPLLANHPNARFDERLEPSAHYMAALAYRSYKAARFEEIAYFEPFYLKDFIAGQPRVKGLF